MSGKIRIQFVILSLNQINSQLVRHFGKMLNTCENDLVRECIRLRSVNIFIIIMMSRLGVI